MRRTVVSNVTQKQQLRLPCNTELSLPATELAFGSRATPCEGKEAAAGVTVEGNDGVAPARPRLSTAHADSHAETS